MKFLYLWALSLLLDSFFLSISVSKSIPVANSYDPGPCKNETHGKYVLVKNRADEEKVVICVKDKGIYHWKSMDGSANTVGEFFNPGHDCSDILNNCQDAKDGFFWITAGLPNPKKVWCDMTTDGGGFTLIGKMNTSSTWLVPSNDIPVEPFGDPHWSSSLGEVPILDFRVQMAIKENFKTTVAHWSFRLQATRPLKNLLTTKDGCNKRSAGIGNIAHVKNLQTERVVTTTLRCSKFGLAHRPSAPYGWPKMNLCFTKPCQWGFAHLVSGDFNYRPDDYGAFSYSKTGSISGMENNATAFVGCDNGICCACYGPADGEEEYCGGHCQAINGGEVRKDIFTWFWVRSSLPKELWKKCMDYEVKLSNGKSTWYKLVGHDVIPVQGRCGKDAVLFHDGIVVVPDSKTGQKVPAIDGLLKYRKDKQELYVRSNETWNVLAERKELLIQQQKLENQSRIQQNILQKELTNTKMELEKQIKRFDTMINLQGMDSCKELKTQKPYLPNGNYSLRGFQSYYCDMSNGGWTLIARFSNSDSKNWISNGNFWYDRNVDFGNVKNPAENNDMISEAFWRVKGEKFKITRSDDSSHTALLQTTSNCLQDGAFRSKITSYGDFRNGAVWASDQCRGRCQVSYGGQYTSTAGFEQYSCSSDIQSSNYIGFWCDWDDGDGAVMMIGGGGSACARADHGIGVTEENEAKFGVSTPPVFDFGHHSYSTLSSYSLNLWVR